MEKYYSLTDRQFALIEPILQEERDKRGRKPTICDRHALETVLYILREGCRWLALPECFGHWMMVFMRYKRWVDRGDGNTVATLLRQRCIWIISLPMLDTHALFHKVAMFGNI